MKLKDIPRTSLTTEEQFDELSAALEGSVEGSSHSEALVAFAACAKYLGQDLLAVRRDVEFNALPQTLKDEMVKKRDCGIYGIRHLATRPEVHVALRLAAHELCPDKKCLDASREDAQKPEIQQTISERFPAMTLKRIEKILAL